VSESDIFWRAGEGLRRMGVRVFTRPFKYGCEDPWWPTALPVDEKNGLPLWNGRLLETRDSSGDPTCQGTAVVRDLCSPELRARGVVGCDVATALVREAHAQTIIAEEGGSEDVLRVVAYYWHISDGTLAGLHDYGTDNWVCKGLDGNVHFSGRGPFLDITGPYGDVVRTRLLELADRGVDGFNFDNRHLPPKGCFGTQLEARFRNIIGRHPDFGDGSERFSDYRLFLDFQEFEVARTFARWRTHVKRAHPDAVFVVSAGGLQSLGNRRSSTNLVRIADSAKNEYHHALGPQFNARDERPGLHVFRAAADPLLALPPPDVRMALGWTLLRDSANGRPPRIWANQQANRDHALGFAASILAYGGIAQMHVPQGAMAAPHTVNAGATPRDALEATFQLGNRVSPHLAYTRPLRWAAVHYSELTRNRVLEREGGDLARAWQEVLWPLTGAFGVFVREGLPVGIVNDRQLEWGQLRGYEVLFLPNASELTPRQSREVADFRARGGIVIENDASWGWSDPQRTEAATAAFRAEIRAAKSSSPPPVEVTRSDGLEDEPTCRVGDDAPAGSQSKHCIHAVSFWSRAEPLLVVAVTNDFSWVQRSIINPTNPLRDCHGGVGTHYHEGLPRPECDPLHEPPPPVADAAVLVKGRPMPTRIFEVMSGEDLTPQPVVGATRCSFRNSDLLRSSSSRNSCGGADTSVKGWKVGRDAPLRATLFSSTSVLRRLRAASSGFLLSYSALHQA
jgi:hypothetical protein